MSLKNNFLLLAVSLLSAQAFGQMADYNYARELTGVSEQWHSVTLPKVMFKNCRSDLSDLRIFGITESADTIEAPYLLKRAKGKVSNNPVESTLINTVYNSKGYFYTYEIPTQNSINQIDLNFEEENFDWKLLLEGSQNQQEWFTIVDDYRILAISNKQTDYQFTTLSFPSSKYRYYRVLVNSSVKPKLRNAQILQKDIVKPSYTDYTINTVKTTVQKDRKQSIVDIDLVQGVQLSYLKIDVENDFDYYRPMAIQYVSDSVETEQGWIYSYRSLANGMLSSLEESEFKFTSTLVKKLRITVQNHDNQPLDITRFEAKGYKHELHVRISEPADYYLAYGNSRTYKPSYDIARFTDKIPNDLSQLQLGDELDIDKYVAEVGEPLFKNQLWLWLVMLTIITLLGWFSLKMLSKG